MSSESEVKVYSDPLFIEVPKPVNLMSKSEIDEFIEEILGALEEN
jgi:hypothetical protein